MKSLIGSIIFATIMVIFFNLIANSIEAKKRTDITYNVGKIVALGQCKDGSCSFQYIDKDSTLQFATTDKPVSIGQLVYQQCWYEKAKGNRCYVDYEPSKN